MSDPLDGLPSICGGCVEHGQCAAESPEVKLCTYFGLRPVAVQPGDPQKASEGPVPSVNGRGEGSATTCGGNRARYSALDMHRALFGAAAEADDAWHKLENAGATPAGPLNRAMERLCAAVDLEYRGGDPLPDDAIIADLLPRSDAAATAPVGPERCAKSESECASVRRERDALRASLARIRDSFGRCAELPDEPCAYCVAARALASETGGASTKKS